jgi:hypothetical protein
MRAPSLFALGALAFAVVAPGCQCFDPVADCSGARCAAGDGGASFDGGGGGSGGGGGAGGGGGGGGGSGGDAGKPDGGVCAVWDGGGVGLCAALTGWVREPTVCRGDCVSYPIVTPGVFPTLADCASCGCDLAKFSSVPPGQTLEPALYCDELMVRTSLPRLLNEALPGFDAGCRPVGSVDFECTLATRVIGDAGYARACAATLVPRVAFVQCRIFLP